MKQVERYTIESVCETNVVDCHYTQRGVIKRGTYLWYYNKNRPTKMRMGWGDEEKYIYEKEHTIFDRVRRTISWIRRFLGLE